MCSERVDEAVGVGVDETTVGVILGREKVVGTVVGEDESDCYAYGCN